MVGVGVVMSIFFILGGIFWYYEGWQDYQYQGQVSFDTEAGYTEFKQAIVDYEADILEINVLFSEPPIVVKFKVDTPEPAVLNFPYGEKVISCPISGGFLVAGVVLAMVFIVMILINISRG